MSEDFINLTKKKMIIGPSSALTKNYFEDLKSISFIYLEKCFQFIRSDPSGADFFNTIEKLVSCSGLERQVAWFPQDSRLTLKVEVGKEKKLKYVQVLTNLFTIGRDVTSSVIIDDSRVSRCHGRIEYNGQKAVYYDLGSSHGTLLNGEEISVSRLCDGDVLQFGYSKMTVQIKMDDSK